MKRKQKEAIAEELKVSDETLNLGALLSTKPTHQNFRIWIVGDTPLITNAWSEKARRQMLQKQVKATRGGKEAREPRDDFVSSLYEIGKGQYGFPVTGVKNCILASAHKDKGVARSSVMSALWLDAEMIRTRPALAGAVCDMPLVRIYGSQPEMREDMVKIGSGLNRTANLAYRGQFTVWAMRITGRFNASVITAQALTFLINESGLACGIGEWRNERKGMFGAFHMANLEEQTAWEDYVAGKGPMPVTETTPTLQQVAAE